MSNNPYENTGLDPISRSQEIIFDALRRDMELLQSETRIIDRICRLRLALELVKQQLAKVQEKQLEEKEGDTL